MASRTYTFLALGDSYTIGEGVALHESFPYQAIQLMRRAGHSFNAPEIIARTGWTTDDLKKGIRSNIFQSSYNFVSLLIGSNDQYQEKSVFEYTTNFELLLNQAISFAGNDPSKVFVLSIPDWGNTPFAAGRNRQQVAMEIDEWNTLNQQIAHKLKACYITITAENRATSMDLSYLAADQLHPSRKEYLKWANLLSDEMQKLLA